MRSTFQLIIVSVTAHVFATVALAQQVTPSSSSGVEPPRRAGASVALPTEPDSAAPGGRSALATQHTTDAIVSKINAINEKLKGYQNRITLGKGVLEKWAGTAEMFVSYTKSQQETSLSCKLTRDKLIASEKRGASDVLLGDLKKEVSECESETSRARSQQSKFKQQLDKVASEVDRIEADVIEYGALVEKSAKDRKQLEIERSLGTKLNDLEVAGKPFARAK